MLSLLLLNTIGNNNGKQGECMNFHSEFPHGGKGKQYPPLLEYLKKSQPMNTELKWLDYGAGKGGTAAWLQGFFPDVEITCYDPYWQPYEKLPTDRYDCVYSCDVLEHITRDQCMDQQGPLAQMSKLTLGPVYLIIDLTPAKKTLKDGRNAHVNLQSPASWIADCEEFFTVNTHRTWSVADPRFGKRTRLCIEGTCK